MKFSLLPCGLKHTPFVIIIIIIIIITIIIITTFIIITIIIVKTKYLRKLFK